MPPGINVPLCGGLLREKAIKDSTPGPLITVTQVATTRTDPPRATEKPPKPGSIHDRTQRGRAACVLGLKEPERKVQASLPAPRAELEKAAERLTPEPTLVRTPEGEPLLSREILHRLQLEREKQVVRDATTSFPPVSVEGFTPIDAPRAVKRPKRGSPEESAFTRFVNDELVPSLRDPSKLSVAEIEEEIGKLERGMRSKLEEINPPRKPYVNQRLKRINHEFFVLSQLKAAGVDSPRGQAIIASHLKFTKHVFLATQADSPQARIKAARRVLGIKARKVMASERFKRERRGAPSIRKMWFVDKRKAFQLAMGAEGSPRCEISGEDLFVYHSEVNRGSKSACPPREFDLSPITSLPGMAETRPRACTGWEDVGPDFSDGEIAEAVKRANSQSAPGPDRLALPLFFTKGSALPKWVRKLYNRLRALGVIPERWAEGEVQVTYKKGDKALASNWRPITLLAALYKLLMALLNNRLHEHARKLKAEEPARAVFSHNQAGFRPGVQGCLDNAALLRRVEAHARKHGGKLYQLYIDFKNAFGSPDHELIFAVLDWFNVPKWIVSLLKSVYRNARLRIRFGEGKLTPAFTVEKGTFQGDPFSPTVFNLHVELLIRVLNLLDKIVLTPGLPRHLSVNNGAYADDMVALALQHPLMQNMCNAAELFSRVTEIETNVIKTEGTLLLTAPGRKRSKAADPELRYGDKPLPFLQSGAHYKYLGAEAAGNGTNAAAFARVVGVLKDFGGALLRARMEPWLKSAMHVMFVSPKVNYTLGYWSFSPGQLKKLDAVQRKLAKSYETVRSSICNDAVHAPLHFGGLGFADLNRTAPMWYAVSYVRRLFTGSALARTAERVALFEECRRLATAEWPADELLQNPAALWRRMDKDTPLDLQAAFQALSELPGLRFVGSTASLKTFRLCEDVSDQKFYVLELTEALKAAQEAATVAAWTEMRLHGAVLRGSRGIELAPRPCQAPHMRYPWRFSTGQRKFQFLCDLNQINCNTNLHQWGLAPGKLCWHCGALETTMHVINNCPYRLHLITARHDAALSVLGNTTISNFATDKEESRHDLRWDITPDSRISRSTLRPDLTLTSMPLAPGLPSRADLIDMKTPYPRSDYVARTHLSNHLKYRGIASDYRHAEFHTQTFTIIVPSAGPVPMHTWESLKRIGFPERQINTLIRNMSTASIRANYAIAATLKVGPRLG